MSQRTQTDSTLGTNVPSWIVPSPDVPHTYGAPFLVIPIEPPTDGVRCSFLPDDLLGVALVFIEPNQQNETNR